MSTIDHHAIARRLTADRLGPYLACAGGVLSRAIDLYDWNTEVGGALHEDIGRLEIVFRNTIDAALVAHGGPTEWYRRTELFPGRQGRRALDDIRVARVRARRRSGAETHGKVIAELGLGFWRYRCTPSYLTSLWVPALGAAFPGHPDTGRPRIVRAQVEDRIQRIHFLRNRIAHHEPIHQRRLERDLDGVTELAGWICDDTLAWILSRSRMAGVLQRRP